MPTLQPVVLDVSAEERALAKTGNFSWAMEYHALACHFGVWDEGYNFDRSSRRKVIAETDRRDFCFFWRHRPGMLIPAAKILQERNAQDRDAAKDRRLTIVGLWIAAAALVVNAAIRILERLRVWGFGTS